MWDSCGNFLLYLKGAVQESHLSIWLFPTITDTHSAASVKYIHVVFFLRKTLHSAWLLCGYGFKSIHTLVVPLCMNGILGAVFQSDIKVLNAIWSEVTVSVIPEKRDNKVGR